MNFVDSLSDERLTTLDVGENLFMFHLRKGDKSIGRKSYLFFGGDKNDNRFSFTELFDMSEGRLIHDCHSWRVVFFTKSFKVVFDGHGSDIRMEVKESVLISSKPLGYIPSIRHRC